MPPEYCLMEFVMPCPEGSSGGGLYGWIVGDCETGEIIGSGDHNYGCENDPPIP